MTAFLERLALVAFMVAVLLTVPQTIEQKVAPEPAARPRQAEVSPAPIWSKRCAEQGRTFIAHQADGGPWRVPCTGAPRT